MRFLASRRSLSGMSAPVVESAPSTGSLSEDQVFERMLARSAPPQAADPGDEEQDDEAPVEEPDADGEVEGAEFEADEQDGPVASDPKIRFDDGSELALSEVKRGYLRQQDYTRKTQEAAEARKAVESERAQILAERKRVADQLTPLIDEALSIIENPAMQAELEQLRGIDPGAYAVKVMERNQKQASLQQLRAQQQWLAEQTAREEAERFRIERTETAKRSRDALIEKIPAFKKDFDAEYRSLGKYVIEDAEIPAELWDNEVDHRIILLAWKAKQYDDATRKTPAIQKKLSKAPQTMRPGAPKPPGYTQTRELREATERAHKSGTVEDLADLLLKRRRSARR